MNAARPPRRRPRRSLVSKLIVLLSVAILAAHALALGPLIERFREHQRRATVAQLRERAQWLEHGWCAGLGAPPQRPGAPTSLSAFAAYLAQLEAPAASEVAVFDAAGLPVTSTADLATARALFERAQEAHARGRELASGFGRLALLSPLRTGSDPAPVGWLLVTTPAAASRAELARFALLASGLALGAVLLVGLVTIVGAHRILLRPFEALARANRAVVAGDEAGALIPDRAIPDDELGDLMRARNHIYRLMLGYQRSVRAQNEVLERQRAELERWAHELERRVADKQRELERAHDQLLAAEKLAATGRLAAGLAHELNNPLASIAGYAEDLLQLAAAPTLRAQPAFADFPDSLRTIEEQAYRCKRILNQLLRFARPAPFDLRPLPLGPIVQGVLPLIEHRARGRDVAVLLDLDPELGPALVDRAHLEHVLVNLIENAFDAIETPSGRITICTAAGENGTQRIEIRDTGKGMPPEVLAKVFDPFFTTKPVGEGTGLGLSICHTLVTRMRGRIEVESEPGRGSRFTVVLEDAAAAGPAVAESSAPREAAA
ncbi:MAG: hypothetical protein D6776_04150 [Planctomycetota bacterium]|nr:MAG: hypothetical protein D6776_04150 [Planctomycetota bacterium]